MAMTRNMKTGSGKGHYKADQLKFSQYLADFTPKEMQTVADKLHLSLPRSSVAEIEAAKDLTRQWIEAAKKHQYWSDKELIAKAKQVYAKHDADQNVTSREWKNVGTTYKDYVKGSLDALSGATGALGDIMSGNFTSLPSKATKMVKGAKAWGENLVKNTKAIGAMATGRATDEEVAKQLKDNESWDRRQFENIYNPESSRPTPGLKKEGDKMAIKSKVNKLTRKGFNHPEWYGKYPNFITTNLNYGVRKEGERFPVAVGATINVSLSIPQKNGTISQAYKDMMNALFAKLRGSNSGAFNYDVEDIAAYVEVVRGIRATHAKLVRDIQAINNVDMYISQTPYPLMRVLGYDQGMTDTMIANKAQYVASINQLGLIIDQTFPTPPDMAVFDRDRYLAVTLLEDGKGPKSSIYAYRINQVTAANANGSQVTSYPLSGAWATQYAALEAMINQAHSYVSASYPNRDTFAKIAGDIFKAYGQAGLNRSVTIADLNSKLPVLFDEYLLHQLQNATSGAFAAGTFQITSAQPVFSVTYEAEIGIAGYDNSNTIPETMIPVINGSVDRIINTNKSNVTGLETLSLTRGNYTLKPAGTPLPYDDSSTYEVNDCGTDAISALTAVFYDSSDTLQTRGMVSFSYQAGMSVVGTITSLWSQLDYLPNLYIYDETDATGQSLLMLDLDTYAFMSDDQLRQFNDICVMSLYKTIDVSDQVNFRSVKR